MTSRSRVLGLAAALSAAAVLAGCGSSGPSKEDFVGKADSICAQTNRAHPPKSLPQNATAKQTGAFWNDELTIRTELDATLRSLKVPDSEKQDFKVYNAGTQTVLGLIRQIRAAALARDIRRYADTQRQLDNALKQREKAAIALGFKTCGRKNPAQ